jgi:hypothetical protein
MLPDMRKDLLQPGSSATMNPVVGKNVGETVLVVVSLLLGEPAGPA